MRHRFKSYLAICQCMRAYVCWVCVFQFYNSSNSPTSRSLKLPFRPVTVNPLRLYVQSPWTSILCCTAPLPDCVLSLKWRCVNCLPDWSRTTPLCWTADTSCCSSRATPAWYARGATQWHLLEWALCPSYRPIPISLWWRAVRKLFSTELISI